MITGHHIRAGRAILRLSTKDLAKMAGVSHTAINRFENGGNVWASTVHLLEAALNAGGVRFPNVGSPCVQWDYDFDE